MKKLIKREFLVTITDAEVLPYEESLLDGIINTNHLMYLACVNFQKRKGELDPTRAGYEYFLREVFDDGTSSQTKL